VTAQILTTTRELHSRVSDGIRVRMLWNKHDGRVTVAVADSKDRRRVRGRGSMAPTAEAAARFVAATAAQAAIGRLEDAPALLAGRAGTTVRMSLPTQEEPPCSTRSLSASMAAKEAVTR
jgi:hypothetical protein